MRARAAMDPAGDDDGDVVVATAVRRAFRDVLGTSRRGVGVDVETLETEVVERAGASASGLATGSAVTWVDVAVECVRSGGATVVFGDGDVDGDGDGGADVDVEEDADAEDANADARTFARDARQRLAANSASSTAKNDDGLEKMRLIPSERLRAKVLGIGDEATWENGLSAAAREALERVASSRERGTTTVELNEALGCKSSDHLVKQLVAAGLVDCQKVSSAGKGTQNVTQNVVFLKRFAPPAKIDDKVAYYRAFTRVLADRPDGIATSKDVRERLLDEFRDAELFANRTDRAKTKVFAAAKGELHRLGFVEPVKSDHGDAVRLIKPFVDIDTINIDDEDGDAANWTGRGCAGGIVLEQTFETQLAKKVADVDVPISQAEIFRDFDVAPRTMEKRVLKMSDEDGLLKKVSVQRGKVKMTCFSSTAAVEGDAAPRHATTENVTALIDDTLKRRELLLNELRLKGFLYVKRLSKWLAIAEGGQYRGVDKKVVNALVDDIIKSGDGVLRDITWSITERAQEQILFHIDFPFDPRTESSAAFIEALKRDIRIADVALRQPLSKKHGGDEILSITPMQALPPANESMEIDGEEPERMHNVRNGYRTLNDFHAIGLGYIKAAVIRLQSLHMYLIEKVFVGENREGFIDPTILERNMPISMYIKLVNSAESKQVDNDDLEHIKSEALREKLIKDLPQKLQKKIQSTYHMARLTQRLTNLGLLYEQAGYDDDSKEMRLMLKLSTSARFQIRVADVEDESSWSKPYDLTTVENAEKYWNALENTFKGKVEMDHAMPAPNLTYPRLTATRAWARKWALGLDNCIIMMNRLRESWTLLLVCLLKRADKIRDHLEFSEADDETRRSLCGIALEQLASNGLPNEEAFRAEQLAQDMGIPDGLAHIKTTWRDYCYAQICSAVSDGAVSRQVAAAALRMYARYSRFRVHRRQPFQALTDIDGNLVRSPERSNRLQSISLVRTRELSPSLNESEVFDDYESDDEFSNTRRKFVFTAIEDEFLIFCMIRFIALSGPNALRAEKRDYRAAVVYNDPMWQSRYPQARKRTVVKRWRYLTVEDGEEDIDINTERHDAIMKVGSEYYERGARARRETALPHLPLPAPASDEDKERWDETWDGMGKWSEGIAKQVLQSTRAILDQFPVTYPLPKHDKASSPRRPKPKREERVRRLRAGRELTEADDDIILARLAPIAFLRRRAISFQDESDDSDDDDVSDYDESDIDEEILYPFSQETVCGAQVAQHRLDAIKYTRELSAHHSANLKCVTPSGPQVLALCRALVDNKISMSTTTETAADQLKEAFGSDAETSEGLHFKPSDVAMKALHSVRVEVGSHANDAIVEELKCSNVIGSLSVDASKQTQLKCLKMIPKLNDGTGATIDEIVRQIRNEDVHSAKGALGALEIQRALDDLIVNGSVVAEGRGPLVFYQLPKQRATAQKSNDSSMKSCTRAVAGFVLNYPGCTSARVYNALGGSFNLETITLALARLVREDIICERATEKYTSVVPKLFGGSFSGQDENTVERFYFVVDETANAFVSTLVDE